MTPFVSASGLYSFFFIDSKFHEEMMTLLSNWSYQWRKRKDTASTLLLKFWYLVQLTFWTQLFGILLWQSSLKLFEQFVTLWSNCNPGVHCCLNRKLGNKSLWVNITLKSLFWIKSWKMPIIFSRIDLERDHKKNQRAKNCEAEILSFLLGRSRHGWWN